MKLGAPAAAHLCYCSNIHPGETWPEVRANLERFVVAVKARVSPADAFGVGLRLSAVAAEALDAPEPLEALRAFLRAHELYVFTINGFPYGPFHGRPVKERVYLPDWTTPERVAYTDRLARLLAALLPAEDGLHGSVSTVPGGFRSQVDDDAARDAVARHLADHAAGLLRLRDETGRTITLGLEPEPACMLETVGEAVAFLVEHVYAGVGRAQLCARTGLAAAPAEAALRTHLGICLDTCHAAVEFEEPREVADLLRRAGVPVTKMQLSAGLRLADASRPERAGLRAFANDVYLHQVVARRRDGRLRRWTDLPDALATDPAAGDEWRVHFHVPVFLEHLGAFANTQGVLAEFLALQTAAPLTAHLEVETYTWDVLPAEHRTGDVVAAVARELSWVRGRLDA